MSRISFLGSAALLLASACATIIHGSKQDVSFLSTPSNARVVVDGVARGNTPIVVSLSRKDAHVVHLELEGYQPYETTLTHKVSGWVWGNLVFGGLIGLVVDASSGGMYALTQEQVNGQMAAATQAGAPAATPAAAKPPRTASNASVFTVVVVRHADPSWTRIGTLSK